MIKHLISYIYIIQAEANDDGLSQIQASGDMRLMKKRIYILLGLIIIAAAISFSGCASFANGIKLTLAEKSFSEKAEQHNRDVLNYLSKHDAKSLKNMFCQEIRSTEDLDAQIKAAFDFIDGNIKITDKTEFNSFGMNSSIENGKFLYYASMPSIIGIQTDKGKTYNIGFCEYFANKEHPSYVGIVVLNITTDDGRKCVVGRSLK